MWIGKKVTTYYLKTPFIPISANLVILSHSVTQLKHVQGRLGQVLLAQLHQNPMKNRMCKRAFRVRFFGARILHICDVP